MRILLTVFLVSVFTSNLKAFVSFESSLFFYKKVDEGELKPGVTWAKYRYDDLFGAKQVVNIVRADLRKAQVIPLEIKNCGKVSKQAKNDGAVAAVNGTFFTSGCKSRNFFKIDGQLKSYNEIRAQGSAALLVLKDGQVKMEILGPGEDPREAWHGIGGFPQLVSGGEVEIYPNESTSFFTGRHPRTGVGLLNSRTLIFVTIDGRSSQSKGLRLNQMAQFFFELGAESAMNLDGGGSTTLWTSNFGVTNDPSDPGGERSVTDALAIY